MRCRLEQFDIDRYIIRVAESILLNPLEEVRVRAHVYVG